MALALEQASSIAGQLGLDERDLSVAPIASGDIADSYVLKATDYWIFLKTLPLAQAGLLSAEADGLMAIMETNTVRVPRFIKRDVSDQVAWLALEYLDLDRRSEDSDKVLGRQLAELHKTSSDHFGWRRQNFIGRTPQHNPETANWTEFFVRHRLGFQFDRLARNDPNGNWRDLKEAIATAWKSHFETHQPVPSLIHGDLWSGNAAALSQSEPVVFDPAVHFADRECDLAMTHLFGGFSQSFYDEYNKTWPLQPGHEARRPFYKLYHILNHANLFGGPYLASSARLVDQILSRV